MLRGFLAIVRLAPIWSVLPIGIMLMSPAHGQGSEAKDLVAELLHERLWTPRDAYDAAHFLMIPMHAAFRAENGRRIEAFRHFVQRYLDDPEPEELGLLTKLQFSYLISQFTVLQTMHGGCDDFVHGAVERLDRDVGEALLRPAWQWEMSDFQTMFHRLEWKLDQASTLPSYLKAIFDEELFTLAIAADLRRTMPACDMPVPPTVERAVALVPRVVREGGRFDGEGWLFQPGVWRDHPDYAHAGNDALGPDLPRALVDDIGWDSSHSARFALWLHSFACAFPEGDERRRIDRAAAGFRRQLVDRVLVGPAADFAGIRLTNFMTGDNGVYRYGYESAGPGGGYGPYGLSFTFNLGWWSFFGPELATFYREQRALLPFKQEVLELYEQPVVTIPQAPRVQHPLFDFSGYLRGPLIDEVLSLAVDVSLSNTGCD